VARDEKVTDSLERQHWLANTVTASKKAARDQRMNGEIDGCIGL